MFKVCNISFFFVIRKQVLHSIRIAQARSMQNAFRRDKLSHKSNFGPVCAAYGFGIGFSADGGPEQDASFSVNC